MLQPREPQGRLPHPARPDPATSLSAALLAMAALGLLLGGVLAVYDWRVPGAEWPLFFGVLAAFAAALAVQVLAATVRHLRPGR
jgi:di/tricarboxylate transporter